MPFTDWQFWVVSLIALGAVWLVLRPILAPLFRRRPRVVGKRTTLTIDGTAPQRKSGTGPNVRRQ